MPNITQLARTESLIEALPFIQKYRGQLFVIKYGGSAMEDEHTVDRLLRDVVFLEAVGINPVLIHGGGKAITSRMREAGIKARFVNGLRVTCEQSIRIVEEVLSGTINPNIVSTLNEFGGRAQGISGKEVFQVQKLPAQIDEKGEEVDLGFVGEVTGCALDEVRKAVEEEIVPVISPIGRDAEGRIFNINADTAAGAAAAALGAEKMIYLSDVPGIMRDPKQADSLIPTLSVSGVQGLIEEGIIAGGMIPKVLSAMRAVEQGVKKVHFIDGRIQHSLLLEIFTNTGVGTEIVA
ncbi:MAG: acetylglutamate kinase [Chthoniobacteraceae bacterium]|nr:acetylglutamate kinase [Chthoniobacteraceae bacterium]